MKRRIAIILLVLIVISLIGSLIFLYKRNKASDEVFRVRQPEKRQIVRKSIATGKIVPKEEVTIKPNISGIVKEVVIKAGDYVKTGDLIAKLKIVPNISQLSTAKNRMSEMQAVLKTEEKVFRRQEALFGKKAIAIKDFEAAQLKLEQAKINFNSAKENYEIIRTGTTTTDLGAVANTRIRSTISGMVLDVPIKKGNQVVQTNNFNEGTTIAVLADINKMIFEGTIDETEVENIKEGMEVKVTIGAIQDKTFDAVLDYVSPKGKEENGAVKFPIKCTLQLEKDTFIRSGLSANVSIIIEQTEGEVLCVNESLIQYDKEKKPFVEIEKPDLTYEKKYIDLGISDGLFVEIKKGLTLDDKIKIWLSKYDTKESSPKKRR